ncbi:hypothetical protein NQ314_003117 [Rhamnusium bicolor]|uniref:Uncharacterized protein n=1 Tax=Rhamnusium bicolor TaxID=1586634 RepID=A0AAV8ZPP3_9CUCU|nr:hypothetical protein NQ314_003117 [Rhamnusium bicolor]
MIITPAISELCSWTNPSFSNYNNQKTWIYAVPESENLILNCGKTRNTVPIEGSGFLHVNEFCSVRASNFVLISLVEYTKPVESNYSPPFNLTKFLDLSELDEFEMKISRYEQMILPFDFEKLSKISYVFEGSKQKLASLYYILLVPIIILVFVISYLVYKKKIDARNILNSNKIFSRNREQPPDNSLNEPDHEKLQIRVKLNKKNDEIKKISVHEDQSTTDPDSEYLTVRFKVKKDKNTNNNSNQKNNKESVNLLKNNLSVTSKVTIRKERIIICKN